MSPHEPRARDESRLQTFLQEARVALPSTQLLGGFLLAMPLQPRYETLSHAQRTVFLITFLCTMLAMLLFTVPAIYHRIACPIADKDRFVTFATRFVIAGFVPLSASTILSVHLVASMVLRSALAAVIAAVFAALLVVSWWIVPLLRLHAAPRDVSGTTSPQA